VLAPTADHRWTAADHMPPPLSNAALAVEEWLTLDGSTALARDLYQVRVIVSENPYQVRVIVA
jgi:hypothetical protein